MKNTRSHEPRGERGPREVVATAGRVGRRIMGTSESDLLAKAKAIAYVPEALDDSPPRYYPVEISSNRIDAYFTVMDPDTTLTNFAAEANGGIDGKGVGVQNSHKTDELPWGRSLTGEKVETTEGGGDAVTVVRSIFFTIPGYSPAGLDSDVLIRGIDLGMITDISVGFYGGEYRCGLCGGDMFAGWFGIWGIECNHVPGEIYDRLDPITGDVIAQDLAFARIVDAHLSEYSTVYDGATPGASVLKARAMAMAGALTPDQVRSIEQRLAPQLRSFGIRLSGGSHVFPGWTAVDLGDGRSLVLPEGGDMRSAVTAAKAKARAGAVPDVSGTDASKARKAATPTKPVKKQREVDDTVLDDEDEDEEDLVVEAQIDDATDDNDTQLDLTDDTDDVADDDEDDDEADGTDRAIAAGYEVLRTKWLTDSGGRIKLGTDPLTAIDALCRSLLDKSERAKDATALRARMIQAVLREGRRAHGVKFDSKRWKRTLEGADPADLAQFLADFRSQAATVFDGKRHSIESDDHDLEPTGTGEPAHLFASSPVASCRAAGRGLKQTIARSARKTSGGTR
jgi:hypothetical protein